MGLDTRPASPLPIPLAPPLIPYFLHPLYGSPTMPNTPNDISFITD